MNDHGGPRRFGNGARVITGVPLTSVGDVQATDGSVGQQVRFHAVPDRNVEIVIIFTAKRLDIFISELTQSCRFERLKKKTEWPAT